MENLGSAARERILNFHSSCRKNTPQEADTVVFPVIQAGYMGVRQEEDCLRRLFFHLNQLPDAPSAVIDLTSGYFALHKLYQDLLINSPVKARVLAASCKVNFANPPTSLFFIGHYRQMVSLDQKVYPAEFQKDISYSCDTFGSVYYRPTVQPLPKWRFLSGKRTVGLIMRKVGYP